MAKISKLYPGFYNGESEQMDELILDTQCREMINCIPSIISGLKRRNGTTSVIDLNELSLASNIFHTYNRGEDDEEYVFIKTTNSSNPLRIFTKDGVEKTVAYDDVATTNTYLGTVDNLKALTVQDRTFILSKDKEIGQTTVTADSINYTRVAYYWLNRSSNDLNNKYTYGVVVDGTTFTATSQSSTTAANTLQASVNGNANFTCTVSGSVIRIVRTDGNDFTFTSFDSWGSRASRGFKGSAKRLSELPSELGFPDPTYLAVTGDDTNDFNDYFVKYINNSWVEWKDPTDTRGALTNMPIFVDRLSDGTFNVGVLPWETPKVGNIENNADPTFLGSTIETIFFYKNRLGFASGDNLILSETGGYYNLYIKTALDILDDDPIDVAAASSKASRIFHVVPFQGSLYAFTKETQFELVSQGSFSPVNVSIVSVSNYTMDTKVAPKVSGNSLYFVSNSTSTISQLREYIKDENTLIAKGIDTTLGVPTLLPQIDKIVVSSSLGYVFCYSKVTKNTIYCFKVETTGTERVQSAWFKWTFSFDIENLYVFDTDLYLLIETGSATNFLKLCIVHTIGTKEDTVDAINTIQQFESTIKLPRWLPKIVAIGNPIDNIQIKRATIHGIGEFNVDIYRKGYDVTISRTYTSGSLKDMSASVLGRSDDVVLTIKSNANKDFTIDVISLEGFFKQSSREVG